MYVCHGQVEKTTGGPFAAPCGRTIGDMVGWHECWSPDPLDVTCENCLRIFPYAVRHNLYRLLPGGYPAVAFKPYDEKRFGKPFVGLVTGWKAQRERPHAVAFSHEWCGSPDEGGVAFVMGSKPGDVLRWGQKDKHTRTTGNEGFGVVLPDNTVLRTSRTEAREWWLAHTRTIRRTK